MFPSKMRRHSREFRKEAYLVVTQLVVRAILIEECIELDYIRVLVGNRDQSPNDVS